MKNVLTLLLLFPLFTLAQTNEEETKPAMITNRPGYTEASRAVYKKGLQFEMGLQYAHQPHWKGASAYSDFWTLPTLGVLYGVSNNVEIRAFGVVTHQVPSYSTETSTEFSDLNLGAKINLTKANGYIPEMAVLVNQTVPANRNSKLYSSGATLALSYALPKNFSVAANLGYAYDWVISSPALVDPHHFNYTVNVGYAINNNFGVFGELSSFNNFENGKAFYQDVEAGAWYRFNPQTQVDVLGGYTSENGGYFIELGTSILLIK